MRKNLPAIGQSYKHDDLPLSAQVTRNWFPEINTETSRVVTLQPFPGAVVWSSGEGVDRGSVVWNGALYKVSGTTLYKIDRNSDQASVGPIAGDGRCTFPASQEYLVIVTSGRAYLYDGSTLSQITDVDLESPDYGTYLNNQWIYQGVDGRFAVSDAGQPDEINGLNYATAESDGDALVRPYVYNQLLYLFGTRTIETWYNSGVGKPPFDRVEGGIAQQGTNSPDSISHNDNLLYFLGDDRLVYQMSGVQARPVSTIPIAREFESYTQEDINEAIGFCYTIKGQNFYQLRVGDNAWVFSETAGGWFELTYRNEELAHPATDYIYAYGKQLIADGGDLLELTGSLYNGLPMIRERVTGLVSGELFGEQNIGRYLFNSRIEIIIKGVPPLGDAPQVMLTWSDDAGETWSNERVIDCGVLGNYTFRAMAYQLGRFRDRVYKIRISDESSYSLHRMSGDFNVGD